jgi:phospholipase C
LRRERRLDAFSVWLTSGALEAVERATAGVTKMANDRRKFLKSMGLGAMTAAFPPSIRRALALPANHRTGTLEDVEHVVFLMQENRSFDQYFGTLRGVRGFGDPRAVKLPSGDPVWYQPDGADRVLPFRPDLPNPGFEFIEDVAHGWNDSHRAFNGGKYDQWIPAKGSTAMIYMTREDLPFHYALADAFTVCDAYHCSLMGPTDPNRYHMWTGWTGNDGRNGGPVLSNAEAGYDWSTYPERLVRAGISWKVYQDQGLGLDADDFWGWGPPYIGNYGDNSLLYFHQYQNAAPGSPLFQGARTGTDVKNGGTLFDQLKADVMAGKLPHVSWVVAPEAYSEHPNWVPNFGAYYAERVLDALTSNPEVWSKTVLFYMFDEAGGFFDHVVQPTPPVSREQGISTVGTTNEVFAGDASFVAGPYGFGSRVPMIVISPFSKGGWVNSELFDHTSLIRFLEARFGHRTPDLTESNITPWRRAVAGDLTSAFDFRTPDARVVTLPDTSGYAPPDQTTLYPDVHPDVPGMQSVPKQEPGLRHARAVPYVLHAHGDVNASRGTVDIQFSNTGRSAAVFQVRSGDGQRGPWTYTVGAGDRAGDTWRVGGEAAEYDLSVYAQNGFFRSFKGSVTNGDRANLSVRTFYDPAGGVTVEIQNRASRTAGIHIADAYTRESVARTLSPGRIFVWHWSLSSSFGWYDLTVTVESDPAFRQQIAGHVETGQDSVSDPLLGV